MQSVQSVQSLRSEDLQSVQSLRGGLQSVQSLRGCLQSVQSLRGKRLAWVGLRFRRPKALGAPVTPGGSPSPFWGYGAPPFFDFPVPQFAMRAAARALYP